MKNIANVVIVKYLLLRQRLKRLLLEGGQLEASVDQKRDSKVPTLSSLSFLG